jgi:hypothetical protein
VDRIYPARGPVSFGLDAGASGTTATASRWTLAVVEYAHPDFRLLYAREWEPSENPRTLRDDILHLWRFFQPEGGFGDAFAAPLIQDINHDLWGHGFAPAAAEDPNTEASWKNWIFQPLRNHGVNKHRFYQTTRNRMAERRVLIPDVVDHCWDPGRLQVGPRDPVGGDDAIPLLLSQLGNLQTSRLSGYDKITPENPILDDDLVDGFAMAVYHADQVQAQIARARENERGRRCPGCDNSATCKRRPPDWPRTPNHQRPASSEAGRQHRQLPYTLHTGATLFRESFVLRSTSTPMRNSATRKITNWTTKAGSIPLQSLSKRYCQSLDYLYQRKE